MTTALWFCLAFWCAGSSGPNYLQVGPFDSHKLAEDAQAFLAATCPENMVFKGMQYHFELSPEGGPPSESVPVQAFIRPDRYRCWSVKTR